MKSLVSLQQEAAEDANLQVFRSIGKGFCAEIYDQRYKAKTVKAVDIFIEANHPGAQGNTNRISGFNDQKKPSVIKL